MTDELNALERRIEQLEAQARRRRVRASLIVVIGALVGASAFAANGSCPNGLPFCFEADAPAKASEVNHDFAQLKEWLETKVGVVGTPAISVTGLTVTGTSVTNVGRAIVTPAQVSAGSLNSTGPLIRQIARWQGALNDTTQSGELGNSNGTRRVTINKQLTATGLRVTWSDNLRVSTSAAPGGKCRWELLFNGQPCANPRPLFVDKYVSGGNFHDPSTIVATCFGLAQGSQVVTIRVTADPNGNCFTGWDNAHASLEAEEVY